MVTIAFFGGGALSEQAAQSARRVRNTRERERESRTEPLLRKEPEVISGRSSLTLFLLERNRQGTSSWIVNGFRLVGLSCHFPDSGTGNRRSWSADFPRLLRLGNRALSGGAFLRHCARILQDLRRDLVRAAPQAKVEQFGLDPPSDLLRPFRWCIMGVSPRERRRRDSKLGRVD